MQRKNKILFWFFAVLFISAVMFAIFYYQEQQGRANIYEKITDENRTGEQVPETPESEEQLQKEEPEPTGKPIEIPIDFETLQAEYPDIYAWIRIPDTNVDYPIVQSVRDQAYYLDHTIEGKEGLPGSIYTQDLNKKDFSDKNTVIYGHNMKDGTMFGGLHQYMDPSYMHAHPIIYIYTSKHIYQYQVFAAVTYDNRHILQSYDFNDDGQYQEYLDSLYGVRNLKSYIDTDVDVTTENRIITLSTCNGNSEQRFLVEAVLISEE